MYAKYNNPLPVWIIVTSLPAHISINSHPFLVGIVTASQEANRPSWQGLQVHKSGTIYTHSYVETSNHMYDWILLKTCSLINLFCNRSFVQNMHQVNTTLSLATNAGMMMTNLKAELPSYSMVWFDPKP